MNFQRRCLIALSVVAAFSSLLVFKRSQGEVRGDHEVPSLPPGAEMSAHKYRDRSEVSESAQLIGMKIVPGSNEAVDAWARKLSRNPLELQMRRSDLKHLKRAEVIEFTTISDNSERLSTDQLPVTLTLPSFDGGTMEVVFDHLSIDGPEGGTLAGKVVGQVETFVVLGFHNGETSGFIEGPNKAVFLDAFDQKVVILRELDAASHAADFQCDCIKHQAAARGADAAARMISESE